MKVVLAYSGGLDTSAIVPWLREKYAAEVVCFVADIGQGEDLAKVAEKAKRTGASKVIVEDLREKFARDFVFPMLRAAAVYEGLYLLGTSIARPLIAEGQVAVALAESADAIAHGATGKGNDQVRFELAAAALAPSLRVIAPWREWEYRSRTDLINYCASKSIDVQATAEKPYSTDANLVHISYEGGILEDPWKEAPEEIFKLTRAPEKAPDAPRYIEVEFERGSPVAIDGERYSAAGLMLKANEIGGEHGIGRVDMVENRYVGIKSRGVYETPGLTILHLARRAVEQVTLDREALHLRDSLSQRYAECVYYGYWFAPERRMLQLAIDDATAPVTGTARLKLYKGQATIAGRKAPRSLYDPHLATFEADRVYDHKDAAGFIRLNALRLKVGARVAAQGDPKK
jgi:argininosuccinate synthase